MCLGVSVEPSLINRGCQCFVLHCLLPQSKENSVLAVHCENEIGTMPLFWKHVAGHNFSLSMFDCQLVLASV